MPYRIAAIFRRWTKPVVVLLLSAGASGFLYEKIGEWHDHRMLPQVGHSIDIGGRSLNIYCSGGASPTVILDGGKGAPGYGWVYVQREVARFARACWYDRAGYGWSDPGPYPRTSVSAAQDLHRLLRAAGVQPPYLLVGASIGGFNVRVYNGLYPGEVAGMVLVDAAHEDEGRAIPRNRGHQYAPFMRRPISLVAQAAYCLGVLRLFAPHPPPGALPTGMTVTEWATLQRLTREPKIMAITAEEFPAESGEQARAAGPLGSIPLVVLTAAPRMRARRIRIIQTRP